MAAEASAPWQLRGMATDPAVRGTGAGRALVAEGLARVAARGGDLVWCDARLAAVGFYERMGFAVVTQEYDKPEGRPAPGHDHRRGAGSGWSPPAGIDEQLATFGCSVDWVTPASEWATDRSVEGR